MTIVALSSGRLPAAIAIVRLSGPDAFAAARAVAGSLPKPRRASLRDIRDPLEGDLIDQAIVLTFPGPKSATGEDIVEFHCHGSRAVVERLLDVLTAQAGVRLAEPGEFTRQSLRNGIMDLTEAEGLGDLLESETEGQRRAALRLVQGGLHERLEHLRQQLIDLSAHAEAAIDYVGDEDETSGQEHSLQEAAARIRSDVEALLALPERRPLRDGIQVVLGGPPNSGKSSLLNALVGFERAIVSAEAGTTRDSIDVALRIDGIAYVLTDTAGLRDGEGAVERMGIDRSNALIDGADILLWLGDPEDAPAHPRLIRVTSKIDVQTMREGADLGVSSTSGENLELLLARLRAKAETILPAADGLSLTSHHRSSLEEVRDLLQVSTDLLMLAEAARSARHVVDRLVGVQGMEDVIDRIFARFCLGK